MPFKSLVMKTMQKCYIVGEEGYHKDTQGIITLNHRPFLFSVFFPGSVIKTPVIQQKRCDNYINVFKNNVSIVNICTL